MPDKDKDHDVTVKVVDRRRWANAGAAGETTASDASGSLKPTYVEQLEQQLAEKDRQAQEFISKYRQASAEFEEARLRLRREIAKDVERARRDVIIEMLEVLDNLDRAIASARPCGVSMAIRMPASIWARARCNSASLRSFADRSTTARVRFNASVARTLSVDRLTANSPVSAYPWVQA